MSKLTLQKWQDERDKEVLNRVAEKSNKYVKKLTPNHIKYMSAIESHSIIFCYGPAGTGKTTLACQVAAKMLNEGKIQRIVLTRPLVECGGQLGILPGNVEEKMSLFVAPMVKGLKAALGETVFEHLKNNNLIEIIPLEQMRGSTFDNALVIVDEPQNASFGQLHMALTRLGDGTKIVLCGDLRQSDLYNQLVLPLYKTGLVLKKLKHPQIKIIKMTSDDVLRPDIVSIIDEAMYAEMNKQKGSDDV